jgi:hypothetical protein
LKVLRGTISSGGFEEKVGG